MPEQSLYHTYQRYRSLHTNRISVLPIVVLMPHSACNCRCVMCDIWKGNHHLRQLNEADISTLLKALGKLDTKQVLMSGGEALLNPLFFRFCAMLKERDISVSLLSTGLLLEKHADQLVRWVQDIIVSLDGDPELHDRIRRIPGAFRKMQEGIRALRAIDPVYRVTARSVIHRLNFRQWQAIVDTAMDMQLDRISFLPADTTSQAFNRPLANELQQTGILVPENELDALGEITGKLVANCKPLFTNRFIAESPDKLWNIHRYYAAMHGRNPFPYKKCNAPWVSTVIEADGTVRPCFFHDSIGNIREDSLTDIINGSKARSFRRELDMDQNDTCRRCVCYLNLHPGTAIR